MKHVRLKSSIADCRLLLGICLPIVLSAAAVAADDLFPPELVRFVPYEQNPVFTAGGKDHWDVRIRERGWILPEGKRYHMWFTGYDGTGAGLKMLGYATSDDGLKWTRHPSNPIYRKHWVEDMMVVGHDGTYYMFAEGRNDIAQLLTSTDRTNWQRQGSLDVRKADGRPIEPGPYGTPTAWFENGTWHLFYERRDLGIWLATSKDMKVWTNVRDEPVLKPGPDRYDRKLIALNQIVQHKGRYYAYYHGTAAEHRPSLWSTNVATSTDLIRWKKYPGNPLLPIEANKSSGILVHDGKQFRLYTMHDEVHVHFPLKDAGERGASAP